MASRYRYNPDPPTGRMDTEVAAPRLGASSLGVVTARSKSEHVTAQDRARAHDVLVEGLRITRATKDRDRIYPRAGLGEVKPRRGRHALVRDEARVPLTAAQARRQYSTKRRVAKTMPRTEKVALTKAITDHGQWVAINEALQARGHDRGDLTEPQARDVGRIDRAIRRFEAANDRSHRVYAALDLDPDVVRNLSANVVPGERFTLDGYTACDHSPHKVADQPVLLEITGTRGIYLGDDGNLDNTGHLLPRGVTFQVDGIHDSDIVTDHGTIRRTILSAHLIETETKK